MVMIGNFFIWNNNCLINSGTVGLELEKNKMDKTFELITVFYKDDDGYFQSFSPNVKGAVSLSTTLDEARKKIRKTLKRILLTAVDSDFNNYIKPADYNTRPHEIVEIIPVKLI